MAACFVSIGFYDAHADGGGDVARAAVRRAIPDTTTVSTTNTTNTTNYQRQTATIGRVVDTGARTTAARTVNPRPITTVVSRTPTNNLVSRNAINTRTTTTRANTTQPTTRVSSRTISRAASNTVTREDIMSRDYSKCKTVFFDCMDEFCANKDNQLKRCACSSRIHEFDSVKKQLEAVDDKMLDFNQRLLTVSMEKEDAAALNVATEGETAFLATKDTSASKRTLDAIAKKLNTSFDSSNFDNSSMNALSWSIDIDSAFDTVDSLRGASTTTKTGTALYSAALPVCREMAAEVCAESDISIAEGGYQALIEQDCNTVAKTYKSQTDHARAQVLESSALLDMSRLNIYQQRNSDDILTCKKKMLDMLTDSTVCGDGLGKCLDVTGRYIDPSTGQAFLSPELVYLDSLLTRPTGDGTWSGTSGNASFVSFLNSKKKFLEPAMEQCQDIADSVWTAFVEDALSQIKLAQEAKLEEVRQSCTKLTSECLSDATESIKNFDARALSTFGIIADKTANAMCSDIMNACTALMGESDATHKWETGVSQIVTNTTYETMMQTCRQVGRACIIQVCTSTSGNFGLCESISNSVNRKSILNNTVCWNEVKECIASVGESSIDSIIEELGKTNDEMNLNFYKTMYANANPTPINQMCVDECHGSESNLFECRVCRLAESIWGNCEYESTTELADGMTNKIIATPDTVSATLLYWFAINTGTDDNSESCRSAPCSAGKIAIYDEEDGALTCIDKATACFVDYKTSGLTGCSEDKTINIGLSNNNPRCNCCPNGAKDSAGNCCASGYSITEDGITYCVSSPNSIVMTEPYTTLNYPLVYICDNGEITTYYDRYDHKTYPKCTGTLIGVALENDVPVHYFAGTSKYVTEQMMYAPTGATPTQCMRSGKESSSTYDPTTMSAHSGNYNYWRKFDEWSHICTQTTPQHWSVVFKSE